MTKRRKRLVGRMGLILMSIVAAGLGIGLGGVLLVGLINMAAP